MDDMTICQQRASTVASLISGDKYSALSAAIKDPPVSSKDPACKELNSKTVQSVLDACDEGDIDVIVAKLSDSECDILMKYVYRILGDSSDCSNSGAMLKWHAKLTKKTGLGAIVRTMTDRKTV
eukprot:CAMPEP_0118646750 /NCGR_PEP_ID=MMETSP0785-20121206/8232_1 /TAXON_ID=91992 /ORGANISM="Bolidomonas pacifica, Strain CCMP 1866" /LENGTH=123 /DNA_ID=CAMNT_0006538783 /DNA_START=43 /DNA_END=414 /DNA_ORIENTATION=+